MVFALDEMARARLNRKLLLPYAFLALLVLVSTSVLSRAAYDRFEGLLVFSSFALITAAACFGIWLSSEIEKLGHLLPLCLLAAGVDILSVYAGPSKVVVSQWSEHVQHVAAGIAHYPPLASYLILRYPHPGFGLDAMIGVGDLAFFAILAGTVVKFNLPRFNIPLLAFYGFLATLAAILLQAGVPALPFIGIGFVITNITRMKLDKMEWAITIALLIIMAIVGAVLRWA